MDHSSTFNRRRLLGLLASAGAASWIGALVPHRAQARPQTGIPATNINDALKHPRGSVSMPGKFPGRVVRAVHDSLTAGETPDLGLLDRMVGQSLIMLTGAGNVDAAWKTFLTPDDVVGLKVNPVAGKLLSTSTAKR
jgi:hypothetical protein